MPESLPDLSDPAITLHLGDIAAVYDGDQPVARLRIVDAGPQMDAKRRVLVEIDEPTPPHRPVVVSVGGQLLLSPPSEWIVGMLTDRIGRLSATVRKLAGWAGHDIADLIDEGYLQVSDL